MTKSGLFDINTACFRYDPVEFSLKNYNQVKFWCEIVNPVKFNKHMIDPVRIRTATGSLKQAVYINFSFIEEKKVHFSALQSLGVTLVTNVLKTFLKCHLRMI